VIDHSLFLNHISEQPIPLHRRDSELTVLELHRLLKTHLSVGLQRASDRFRDKEFEYEALYKFTCLLCLLFL